MVSFTAHGMIKVSRPLKELAGKVGAAREKLEADLGREPTVDTYLWKEGVNAGKFKVKFREPVPII